MNNSVESVQGAKNAGKSLLAHMYVAAWLKKMAASDLLDLETYTAGLQHFELRPNATGWRTFIMSTSLLLGVLLFVTGVIFFMAWNWQAMHKFTKFFLVEGVFCACAAYALLRWKHWSAQATLLATGLCIGALLALYGQIYQTGADAWELFRAWSLILIPLAFAGRSTGLWFMLWLVGNLWINLYFMQEYDANSHRLFATSPESLFLQLLLLAGCEAAHHMRCKVYNTFDELRWLTRTIGTCCIVGLTAYAFDCYFDLRMSGGRFLLSISNDMGLFLYMTVLGIFFYFYFRVKPDFFFVVVAITSITAFVAAIVINAVILKTYRVEAGSFFLVGAIIVGVCIAAAKVIFICRKSIQQKAVDEATQYPELHTAKALHQNSNFAVTHHYAALQLRSWLEKHIPAQAVATFFEQEEKTQAEAQPWYMKLPLIVGIWIGALFFVVFFAVLIGSNSLSSVSVLGLLLCFGGVGAMRHQSFAIRQAGLAFLLCGIIMAGVVSLDNGPEIASIIYTALFIGLWLVLPAFSAKVISLAAAMDAVFLYLPLSASSYHSYEDSGLIYGLIFTAVIASVSLAVALIIIFAEKYIVATHKKNTATLAVSAAYGFFVFSLMRALLYALLPGAGSTILFFLCAYIAQTVCVALAAASVYLSCTTFKQAKVPCLMGGLFLAFLAWFSPGLALGAVLMLMGRYFGNILHIAAGAVYTGVAVYLFYYNFVETFLVKSFILMGNGVLFILLSVAVSFMLRRMFPATTAKEMQQAGVSYE